VVEASDRLLQDFRDVCSPETINELLRESTHDLAARASVPNFVPLLAERRTRERLAVLAQG
jgi:hypothetical protein